MNRWLCLSVLLVRSADVLGVFRLISSLSSSTASHTETRKMERKLDLSRLTDEEAKHVWEVIQRDFNLRKNEEERLTELKTRIEKEDTKQELLGSERNVSDSLCIRCLQPFKFLVNSKRQCLDCRMFTCKSCSRYNKKEHGWVCDNCRMTRVLKMGTLGWYHDNVRNRFKRFGSAKVMRSLYKRLNGDGGRDDDTQSMPDVGSHGYNGTEDDPGEGEAQSYKVMRKNKRLLSVHPMDFDSEDYLPRSRRPSEQQMQDDRYYRNDGDYDYYTHRGNRRKSLDRYAMRPGQQDNTCSKDDYADNRMVRTRSLSKISSSVARQQYVDTSDEEEYQRFPPVHQQPHHRRKNSRASSQENLGQAPPINELNKRMFAIESLLSRLEEKMTPADEALTSSAPNEEEKLRRKLSELAGNLSDKCLSSDDEAGKKVFPGTKGSSGLRGGPVVPPVSRKNKELSSSSDEMPTEAQKVYITAGQSYELESKLRRLEQSAKNRFGGTTDSELSELEDVVALTAARVQSAESEVSDIESKIAALSAKKKRVTALLGEPAICSEPGPVSGCSSLLFLLLFSLLHQCSRTGTGTHNKSEEHHGVHRTCRWSLNLKGWIFGLFYSVLYS
ncbi:melanophilin a isoform X6 [Xiphophorus hellerii]|uniref:melanophilin a isoform X6 n=1 Tax=Xiphophorus hellerii TaxID=8084 RepID=UPI0013B3602E|nr:melanophilin-like isoform X6 [Xiphophorus hellerii]